MRYDDVVVLIPSHGLEDFPTELADGEAASLLNCFAAAWHPVLLTQSKSLPRWMRADYLPTSAQAGARRLVFAPTCSTGWLPHGAETAVESEGGKVVSGFTERGAILVAALAGLQQPPQPVDSELVADFLALGHCHIQLEVLSRKMRHFGEVNDAHLRREAIAAADAALIGQNDVARKHLRSCFDTLQEARERFYPVDCYLLDLCLVGEEANIPALTTLLTQLYPVSLLATAEEWSKLAAAHPHLTPLVRESWARGTVDLLGGDWSNGDATLADPNSVLWNLKIGRSVLHHLFGKTPTVWARRLFGLSPLMPQLLQKLGYEGALHMVMDDGIYPDEEYSKFKWEGSDGSVVDAASRIPMAADAAASYLRFATRMSESMDNDHVAGVMFARWPELSSPFLDDFRRAQSYAPVLGRLVTLGDFFRNTDRPARLSRHEPSQYLSPFVYQSVSSDEADPLSRFTDRSRRRAQLDRVEWCSRMANALQGQPIEEQEFAELEREIETLSPIADAQAKQAVEQRLTEVECDVAGRLAALVAGPKWRSDWSTAEGCLVVNPLANKRRGVVSFPTGGQVLERNGSTPVETTPTCCRTIVDVPGSGFVWLPLHRSGMSNAARPKLGEPLAAPFALQNGVLEVRLNRSTGGIAEIRLRETRGNRLSQMLTFRFPKERTYYRGSGERREEVRTQYAITRCTDCAVVSEGPLTGTLLTQGEIVDETNGQKLAGFKQWTTVYAGLPRVDVAVELEVLCTIEPEPWNTYFASRCAWNDPAAALTFSSWRGAFSAKEERIEGSQYFEIASDSQRATLLFAGLPYHRKTSSRMLDTILCVRGETRRRWEFSIAVDNPHPAAAAAEFQSPVVLIPTANSPGAEPRSGWFLHLDVLTVQILSLQPVLPEPQSELPSWENSASSPVPQLAAGLTVRLMETEGRPVRAMLRCFRTPVKARQCDFTGKTILDLRIEDDCVIVDLTSYEIADVELRFDA